VSPSICNYLYFLLFFHYMFRLHAAIFSWFFFSFPLYTVLLYGSLLTNFWRPSKAFPHSRIIFAVEVEATHIWNCELWKLKWPVRNLGSPVFNQSIPCTVSYTQNSMYIGLIACAVCSIWLAPVCKLVGNVSWNVQRLWLGGLNQVLLCEVVSDAFAVNKAH
jgi:hypothetical protein